MQKRKPAEPEPDAGLEAGEQHTVPALSARPAVPSWLVLVRFYACQVLGVFNPRMALQLLRQAVGQIYVVFRRLRAGSDVAMPVQVRLPVDGIWQVHRGGTDRAHSHSWHMLAQRFAYDLVQGPEQPPAVPEGVWAAFPAFGQVVRAVAPGTVIAVRDGCRDSPRPGTGIFDWRSPDIRGNHVMIEHADGNYSLTAHLRNGTVRVRTGQRVEAGEPLGACGNSGISTEPHVHFHMQDHPDFFLGSGRPVWFTDCRFERAPRAAVPGGEDHGIRVYPVGPEQAEPPPAQVGDPVGAGDLLSSLLQLAGICVAVVLVLRLLVRVVLALVTLMAG